MKRALKILGVCLASVLSVAVLTIAVFFGWRAVRQQQNERAMTITSPNGISEKGYFRIGGIDQYVEIRGQDRSNPVLLVLHGGPGAPLTPITYRMFLPLEKQFTVVNWDQRGAGRTYARNGDSEGDSMNLARMEQDALELVNLLRSKLHKAQVGIVAASGGSTFGLMLAKDHPEVLYAYVGTGQVIAVQEDYRDTYRFVLATARRLHDRTAVAEIIKGGAPPWKTEQEGEAASKWLSRYSPKSEQDFTANSNVIPLILATPGYGLKDFFTMLDGIKFTSTALLPEFESFDIRQRGLDYKTNLFFFQGDEDHRTSTALVRSFLDSVSAPHKELILLPGGAHTAALALPDMFIQGLIVKVRPFGLLAEHVGTVGSARAAFAPNGLLMSAARESSGSSERSIASISARL